MRLNFLNRTREISRLARVLEGQEPSLMVIYGRRRCGKSTLLQHVARDTDLYYLADQQEAPLQLQGLAVEIARTIPGFADVTYPDWQVLLSSLQRQADYKTCLILDEFPYLVQKSPELPSIIQKLIDSRQNTIHLILCGSSQRMMQGLVMDSSAPLYGRASEILKIRPLPPGWIQEALTIDAISGTEAYAVWGGVPRYWELAKKFTDFKAACKELVLDRDGILHHEPMRLFLDDMKGTSRPHSLLSIIANGSHRLSEIAGRLGKPATSLTRPLANLIELGYIRREYPFGENSKSTKRTIYVLDDPFLMFWYRFVQPNQSLLERDLVDEVYEEIAKQKFKSHVAEIWEELARQSTSHLKINDHNWHPGQRWWGRGLDGKKMEIDVVAESFDGENILFGEAKWQEDINMQATITKLKKCSENFPQIGKRKISLAIWSKKSATSTCEQMTMIKPDQLLAALK